MPNARTLGSRAIATLYCHTTLLLLAICGSAWGDFAAHTPRNGALDNASQSGPERQRGSARRDPIYRAGHWSPKLLRDLSAARRNAQAARPEYWLAALGSSAPMLLLADEGEGGSGLGIPGEGIGIGGSPVLGDSAGADGYAWSGPLSRVNTNTGNHHLQLPLLEWDGRGATRVEFELYHNSLSDWVGDLGHSWSHTYETRIDYTPGSSAILRWAEGTNVGYTETSGLFVPPPGFFDKLTRQPDGSWVLERVDHLRLGFDPQGYLTWIRDRSGNEVSIARGTDHRILAVSDPSGRSLSFQYEPEGRLEAVTDPLGRTWSFEYQGLDLERIRYPALDQQVCSRTFAYDASHNVVATVDREGATVRYGYDAQQRLVWFDDALNHRWTFGYGTGTTQIADPLGQVLKHHYSVGLLTRVEDQLGYFDQRTYNASKLVVAYRDRNDALWQYSYDSMGRTLTSVDPMGGVETFTYDSAGDLVSFTNPLGHITTYLYDSYHNLTRAIDATGVPFLTIQYDPYGQVSSVTDATGATSVVQRNSFGYLTSCTYPGELPSTFEYDLLGNPTRFADPFGNQTTITWDAWGRPNRVRHPDGSEQLLTFDREDRLTSRTDERHHLTQFQYDPNGRVVRLIEPMGGFAEWTYDAAGRTIALRNPGGSVTTFQHTPRSQLRRATFADGAWIEWSFDPCGNPISRATSAQELTWFDYDACGRTTLADYASGADTLLTYDLAGRLTQMSDETGVSQWQYDACDRVTRFDSPQGSLLATYTPAGALQSLSEVGGGSWSVTYDGAGRATEIRDPGGNAVTLQYDPAASRLTRRTFGNGLVEEYSYDSLSRPTTQVLRTSSGQTLVQLLVQYDAASNIASLTRNGVLTLYEYDANNRLTRETAPGCEALYAYDLNGNRTEKVVNGLTETYAYDAGDKLLSVDSPFGDRTYSYDGFGRLTSVQAPGGTIQLTYGAHGRLASLTDASGSTAQFRYSGMGARTSITVGSATTTFLRTGPDVTASILGINAARLLPDAAISTGTYTRFLHGGLKNYDAQSDAQASLVATRWTDAFGAELQSSGAWEGPFRFGGRFAYQTDFDSPFLLVGERYYDPGTGRFLSRDPALQGFNWYAYCHNNPASYADPDGKIPVLVVIAVLVLSTNVAIAPTSPEDLLPERVAGYHEQLSRAKLEILGDLVNPSSKLAFLSRIGHVLQRARAVQQEGQLHHAISKAVFDALDQQPTLKGVYKLRDSRFTTRAAKPGDHVGYQRWHRDLDREIVELLFKHPNWTPKQFEAWLVRRYKKPDLARRFPDGLRSPK